MNKLYWLAFFIFTTSCNHDKCNLNYTEETSCFNNLQGILWTSLTKETNFSKKINCFEWDSLKVGERGSYQNYPCLKFHQICKKGCGTYFGKNLEKHMNWLDQDRDWTFIYFYKNGTLLNNVIAIPQPSYLFQELKKNNKSNLFRKVNYLN